MFHWSLQHFFYFFMFFYQMENNSSRANEIKNFHSFCEFYAHVLLSTNSKNLNVEFQLYYRKFETSLSITRCWNAIEKIFEMWQNVVPKYLEITISISNTFHYNQRQQKVVFVLTYFKNLLKMHYDIIKIK